MFFKNKFTRQYQSLSIQTRSALWYAACNILQKGISVISTPFFSRIMTPDEYGVFSVYMTWESIVLVFATLNLASSVYLRGLIKYDEDENEFTASIYSLFFIVFFVTFCVWLLLAKIWDKYTGLGIELMLMMFADMLVSTAFHFWSAKQRVFYEYKRLVVVTLINAIIKPIVGIIAVVVFADKHVLARVLSFTIVDVVTFGIFLGGMFAKCLKKISTKYWKYALSYNIPLVPHYLSQIVLNQSDRIMIKSICGDFSAGIYSLAYTAATTISIVNQSILNSYNPWMYKQIKEKKYEEINKYSIKLLLIIIMFSLALIVFAPEIIAIFAPASYYEAIWIVPPVAASIYFSFLYSLFANFEFYFEKTRIMMVASCAGAVLNIILNALAIPIFGYIAAGYTTLICFVLYCVAHYLVMNSILKKTISCQVYNMKLILVLSIVFIGIAFLFMMLYDKNILRYTVEVVFVIIGVFKRKELKNVIVRK